MADNMQELKQQKIWMLWRWEIKPDGKRTKVPMSVSAESAIWMVNVTSEEKRGV